MKKTAFMDWPFLLFLFFAVIGPVGTKVYLFYNHALYLPPFNWMETQEKIDPQDVVPVLKNDLPVFNNGRSMQNPVDGTVAQGYLPYAFVGKENDKKVSSYVSNPLPVTEDILAKGKSEYQVYCSVCHGDLGQGVDGMKLRGSHFAPPALTTKKLKTEWSDGNIFHVITEGQGSMSSYAKQIPVSDRWAIVHYLKVLQRAADAKDTDLTIKMSDIGLASNEDDTTNEQADKEHH